MRRDRSLFRSYTCSMGTHQRCRRRYPATVGVIPRICGCTCHDQAADEQLVRQSSRKPPRSTPVAELPPPDAPRQRSGIPSSA